MGNRLSKIYTKTGDDGTTGLGDGTRVAKDSARVAAYGTVDEANSAIGVLLAASLPDAIRDRLVSIQHQLFDLGGELCIPGHAAIDDADVERLEQWLDAHNAGLPALKDFILPGGGEAGGALPPRAHHRAPRRTRGGHAVAPRRGAPAGDPLPQPAFRPVVRARARARAPPGTAKCCGTTSAGVERRSTRLYTHPACLAHDTGEGHPNARSVERGPRRARALSRAWYRSPARAGTGDALLRACLNCSPRCWKRSPSAPTCTGSIRHRAVARQPPRPALRGRRRWAATDWVMDGERRRAFCGASAGHHAEPATAMGFCLFDNVAVAAALRVRGAWGWNASRSPISTCTTATAPGDLRTRAAAAVRRQPPDAAVSGHRRGVGKRRRQHRNAPYPPLSSGADDARALAGRLLPRLEAFAPQLLFVPPASTRIATIPLAQGLLDADDFAWITTRLVAVADRHAHGRIVSTLEGGYDSPRSPPARSPRRRVARLISPRRRPRNPAPPIDAVAQAGRRQAVREHVPEVRSQRAQRTSTRCMPWLSSACSLTDPSPAGRV